MADNTTLNAGAGGDVISTDDIAGVKVQRVKVQHGADGSATDVSAASPLPVDLGANNDVTVTGTVTVDLGANNDVTVTSGAITETNSTAILADTAAMDINLATLAGAVAGTEVQVDVLTMPTVTVDLGANNDVTVTSGTVTANLSATDNAVLDAIAASVAGTLNVSAAAGGAEVVLGADTYTEATSSGVTIATVRRDADTPLADTTNEFSPLITDANGYLKVNVKAGAGSGGTAIADEAAFTAGTTNITPAGALFADTTPDTVAEDQIAAIRMSANRNMYTTIRDAAGNERGLNIAADGSIAVTGSFAGAETPADADATPTDAMPVQSFNMVYNGTSWDLMREGAVAGSLLVDGTGSVFPITAASLPLPAGAATQTTLASILSGQLADGHNVTVDNASGASAVNIQDGGNSITVDGTVAVTGVSTSAAQATQLTALQLIDNTIVAHDAAISGSTGVNVIGLNARSAEPTAVGSADATQALATLLGKQVTVPYAIPASSWSYASTAAVTDTADDVAKAAAGAGIRNYITGIQVFNGHDTVGTEVVIKDGTTVLWRGWAEQTGGGASARFDPPLRGTANTAVNVANITTGSNTYFNLQGFIAAE